MKNCVARRRASLAVRLLPGLPGDCEVTVIGTPLTLAQQNALGVVLGRARAFADRVRAAPTLRPETLAQVVER